MELMIKISLTYLALIFCFCNSNSFGQDSAKKYDSCSLIIYSPYSCYYKFSILPNGYIDLKNYFQNVAKVDSGDSLFWEQSIRLSIKKEISGINNIITNIKRSDSLISTHAFDTYNYEVIIDDQRYISTYGSNKNIYSLLVILDKHLKIINDRCGFFELFRKTIKNK